FSLGVDVLVGLELLLFGFRPRADLVRFLRFLDVLDQRVRTFVVVRSPARHAERGELAQRDDAKDELLAVIDEKLLPIEAFELWLFHHSLLSQANRPENAGDLCSLTEFGSSIRNSLRRLIHRFAFPCY